MNQRFRQTGLDRQARQADLDLLAQAAGWLAEDTHRAQGEFVLIVHAPPSTTDAAAGPDDPATAVLLDALLETLSVRDTAKVAAKITGQPKDALYALALARKGDA